MASSAEPKARPAALSRGALFFDYWIAQPGAKGRKLDWSATWRNWVRNEKLQRVPRASPGVPLDLAAARRAANDEAKQRLGIAPSNNDERTIDASE